MITGVKISDVAAGVIEEVLKASNNKSCVVTSVERSPRDQARVMYENCEKYGVIAQAALYKKPGKAVVEVYATMHGSGASRVDILAKMEEEINLVGPSNVSKHCAGPDSPVWVIDIAPSSISNLTGFIKEAESHKRISKVLKPPVDPAVHLEVLKHG